MVHTTAAVTRVPGHGGAGRQAGPVTPEIGSSSGRFEGGSVCTARSKNNSCCRAGVAWTSTNQVGSVRCYPSWYQRNLLRNLLSQ